MDEAAPKGWRRWWWWICAVLALPVVYVLCVLFVIALVMAAGLGWIEPQHSPPCGSSGGLAMDDTIDVDDPQGGVDVVEHGSSLATDAAGRQVISWGVVVENTGEEVAMEVVVTPSFVDVDGAAVDAWASAVEIPVLLPGQRIGTGGTAAPVDRAADAHAEVAWDRVTRACTHRVVADDIGVDGQVWVDGDGQEHVDLRRPKVTFSATSPVELESPRAYAVFRDASGVIVGGASGGHGGVGLVPRDEPTAGTIQPSAEIPHVDWERTEVYVSARDQFYVPR